MTIVLSAIGTAFVGLWVLLFFRYHNAFDEFINAIDREQYLLPELFFIGFGFIDCFKINTKGERGREKEKRIAEVYGEKYAPFYYHCIIAGQITYALTLIPIGLYFGALSNSTFFTFLALVATVALVVYLDQNVNNMVERKREEILADYPEVLSKLTLLVNAGLVVREAWSCVANTSDRALYKEMRITTEEMNNGVAELDAFYNFSQRCAIKEIKKFTSLLVQNIQKGGTELTMSLRFLTGESWEEKKHRAKRKGETASSKLMIPLLVMFLGILLMVIIPIFSNML